MFSIPHTKVFIFLFGFTTALLRAQSITIMPMGDSITAGYDSQDGAHGGYRQPLNAALFNQATIFSGLSVGFVGASTAYSTPDLAASGQQHHNGFSGWLCSDLNANLDGVANPLNSNGDSNQGGYLITGGHGTGRSAMYPTLLLLQCGTNDILWQSASPNSNLQGLVEHLHTLSPNTIIFIAAIPPINNTAFVSSVNSYNAFIKTTLVPSHTYTRYVDNYSDFLNPDGSIQSAMLGSDQLHPTVYGYPVLANQWFTALLKYAAAVGLR